MNINIRIYPDPVLRIKATDVKQIDKTILRMIDNMKKVMTIEEGVGLAANQIGITKKIILIDDFETKKILINPEIIEKSEILEHDIEGCLSLPNVSVKVARYEYIVVRFQNEKGIIKKIKYTDFLARAVQHEIDHLNGVLIIDYMNADERLNFELTINT